MAVAGGNTISGKLGKLLFGGSEITEILDWTLQIKSMSEKYASSGTGGWKTTREGVHDSSGSFRFKLAIGAADAIQAKIPWGSATGFTGAVQLWIDATRHYDVDVVVSNIQIENDMNDGNITGGSADFEGAGPVIATGF